MKTIITIGRQFGSGGKEVGIRVAKELGIPFYDKELLQEAAKKSGLCEKIFENFDERPKSLLYSIAMDSYMFALPGTGAGDSLEQQVYLATFDTIRHIADQGPCVIIGRCADYLLRERENVIRCYIFAPYQARIRNSILTLGLATAEPQRIIEEVDKARAEYYRSHTGCEVNNTRYRDLFLNSNLLGVEGTADLIVDAVRRKFGLEAPAEEQI